MKAIIEHFIGGRLGSRVLSDFANQNQTSSIDLREIMIGYSIVLVVDLVTGQLSKYFLEKRMSRLKAGFWDDKGVELNSIFTIGTQRMTDSKDGVNKKVYVCASHILFIDDHCLSTIL